MIDADILRYEVGYSAKVKWCGTHEVDEEPPADFVVQEFFNKINYIKQMTESDNYELYLTDIDQIGHRYFVAESKPYKGQRGDKRPWHFKNLTALCRGLGAIEVSGIEADDAIATRHCGGHGETIVCSRDKDFKQLPGWLFSWELGRQPRFGPKEITPYQGFEFFCRQMIEGDQADNIPGLPNHGKRASDKAVADCLSPLELLEALQDLYRKVKGPMWMDYFEEQATLLWLQRKPGEWWSWDVMEEEC